MTDRPVADRGHIGVHRAGYRSDCPACIANDERISARPVAAREPLSDKLENDLRELWAATPAELAKRLIRRGWSAHPDEAGLDYEQMRKDRGWPTPNHMRRTADALDSLTPARYGDVLRWFADLADAALDQPAVPVAHDLPMDPLDESLARRARRKAAMTDRPVADREPLSAEELDAIRGRDAAWPEGGISAMEADEDGLMFLVNDRRALLATLDAARPHEAGLREALDWLRRVIDKHSDECTVLRTASEGGAETDLDSAFGDVTLAFEEGPLLRLAAQPAVPVAGAEDWYDRDAKAFARAHAQTGAPRAAQPEDDGLDVERLARATARVVGSEAMGWHREWAAKVAAEYARLSESSEGVERRDGA